MSNVQTILKQTLRVIKLAETVVCSVGLVLSTLLVFAQVANRYWLHFEIMWFSDLSLYIFIFFMFVSAAFTTWQGGHISVDVFSDKAFKDRPKGNAIYRVCIDVISVIVLSTFLPVTFGFMLRAIQYPEYGTLVRWFNISWIVISLFIALVLVLLHLLVITGLDIEKARKVLGSRSRG